MKVIYNTATGVIDYTIDADLSLERGDFYLDDDQSVLDTTMDIGSPADYVVQNGVLVKSNTYHETEIINDQARLRIQSAYSADDETDEIFKRLREDHPDWTYMERNRILAKRDELIY